MNHKDKPHLLLSNGTHSPRVNKLEIIPVMNEGKKILVLFDMTNVSFRKKNHTLLNILYSSVYSFLLTFKL